MEFKHTHKLRICLNLNVKPGEAQDENVQASRGNSRSISRSPSPSISDTFRLYQRPFAPVVERNSVAVITVRYSFASVPGETPRRLHPLRRPGLSKRKGPSQERRRPQPSGLASTHRSTLPLCLQSSNIGGNDPSVLQPRRVTAGRLGRGLHKGHLRGADFGQQVL